MAEPFRRSARRPLRSSPISHELLLSTEADARALEVYAQTLRDSLALARSGHLAMHAERVSADALIRLRMRAAEVERDIQKVLTQLQPGLVERAHAIVDVARQSVEVSAERSLDDR
jgi:hypothetical protein